ncbi:protein fem-1 homolog B [Nilaparvata lugens]|uniref:protein fem-1 homolog B n=1 Tax=Nilaparvata lugens TaxID=108931 RepID=UPI00193D9031|nr:protein fem-1 homolog B [Nilaparvata lugens]
MSSIPLCFKMKVWYAARDGLAMTIVSLLEGKHPDVINEVLSQKVTEEYGDNCTPLIIAAKNGHEKVVRVLISRFNPDLELEGSVKVENVVVEGASALWCAADSGHLNVVKILVKGGANINHPTLSNSTPLRAACFEGYLDVVKYLTEHGADLTIANIYNNTCLMIAAFKGNRDIVSYLLEKGVDPDEKDYCGETAMHFAAECGHINIVRELLQYNAEITKNKYGMTPLLTAADRTKENLVCFLVDRPEVSLREKIDALELLGASYANNSRNYSLELSHHYLVKTMELRYLDDENPILKPEVEPIHAYDNWQESQTLQQLESIRSNSEALHMESLVIRERILGQCNPEVPHSVIYRGAVFADNARFDRCLDLWLHALHLCQINHASVYKDLLRFGQVFCQMVHLGVDISFYYIEKVLEAAALELERNKEKLLTCTSNEEAQLREEMEKNVISALYVLVISSKLNNDYCKDDDFKLRKLVFKLNRLQVTSRIGQTLLHLCVNPDTPVDEFHTNDVCRFPCSDTAKLLIQCGANVNAMDDEGNTPLHVIVREHFSSDFIALHKIVNSLVEAGAHIDVVNVKGKTAFEVATSGFAKNVIRMHTKINLICMAAKVIQQNRVPYYGQVPQHLEEYIDLHGPGSRPEKKERKSTLVSCKGRRLDHF